VYHPKPGPVVYEYVSPEAGISSWNPHPEPEPEPEPEPMPEPEPEPEYYGKSGKGSYGYRS
jgi:hypothetical protein